MATKKLTIEVDAKTDKAKRKIDALGDTGSAPSTAAPDNLSKALDKAAKAADRFDGDIGKASSSMTKMVRGFAGMGVGLAASYAAGHMQQGAARNAVEYGASAIQGASAGFMMAALGGPSPVERSASPRHISTRTPSSPPTQRRSTRQSNAIRQPKPGAKSSHRSQALTARPLPSRSQLSSRNSRSTARPRLR